MAKKIVRKATRDEAPYIKRIRERKGINIYKHDWPAFAEMVQDGLLAWSPPIGLGQAFRKITVPEHADW